MRRALPCSREAGVMLVEALIALVIFAVGVLAFVGMQAASIQQGADARYRADAAFMADAVIGMMATDVPNLVQYAHNPNGGALSRACTPAASPSINANVRDWAQTVGRMLPQAGAERHQIMVDAPTGTVTVRICWQAPRATDPSNYVVRAVVQ
jgi:type IV pilus assembly protein PilV